MVDCTANAIKTPCYIALKGYSKTQADTLIIHRYASGSGFMNRLGSDTLSLPDVRIFNDTAYSSGSRSCMTSLAANADYEVVVPSIPITYRIEGIAYTSDTVLRWTTERSCGTYGSFSVSPVWATVNGTSIQTMDILQNNTYWITLQR